jgi:hypothetical protein
MAAADMDDAQEFMDSHLQLLQLPHVRTVAFRHLLSTLSSSAAAAASTAAAPPTPQQVSKKVKQLMSSSDGMLFALYRYGVTCDV